ncbi:hypothetical protein KUTeg_022829 [Tegillarca granosa]|uniref:TIR domain-containing protein n=1 Tax=Tegillarca granosa TaxID=220873 RepID=A0ABQ9E3N1_TEGGR|nr:hypothetical protein KUTeg_022829 [Tegillarca granosa]
MIYKTRDEQLISVTIMNRVLEVAVPLAVTAGVGIGFYLFKKTDNKGKASEEQITSEDIEEVKSDLLVQSDNGNSIASQFSVISDGDLDRNDLEADQIDTSITFPDEFQSLVFVQSQEGQGDSAEQRRREDTNNSSGNGSRNGDRRNGGTGVIAQEVSTTHRNAEDILQSVSDLEEDEKDEIHDILILHAEKDRDEVKQFSEGLRTSIDVENLNTVLFEEFAPDIQSQFRTMTVVFERCRFLFVYVTENFTQADLQRYQNEMALMDSISNPKKQERVIPVWTCEQGERILPELGILVGINYRGKEMDETFRNLVKRLILFGRKTHLTG